MNLLFRNFCFAALLLAPAALEAQRLPTNYTIISYRRIAPDKVDAFLEFAKGPMRKIQQSRLAAGEIKAWSLLKLTMPYAAGSDYNYIIATAFDRFPNLDMPPDSTDAMTRRAGLDPAEYRKKNSEFGPSVRQEIIRGFVRFGQTSVGDFVRLDYHQTPPEHMGELMDLEENVFGSIFKSLIDAGDGFSSWGLNLPVLPNGNDAGYSFVTIQAFKDSDRLGKGFGSTEDTFKKLFPNRPYLQTMERSLAHDKIVKVRIYHLLDRVGAPIPAK